MSKIYEEAKLEKIRIQRQIFLNFKFSIVWKRREKKFGGSIGEIHRNKVRKVHIFMNNILNYGAK